MVDAQRKHTEGVENRTILETGDQSVFRPSSVSRNSYRSSSSAQTVLPQMSTSKPLAHRPTGASPPSSSSQARHDSRTSSGVSRPPVRASSSATIPDSISLQGTNLVTIGAGSVLHPRIKILAFDGPVTIGEGCIIGEKSVIGGSDGTDSQRHAAGSRDDAQALQTPTTPQSPSDTNVTTPRNISTSTITATQESRHNPLNAHTIISNSVAVGPLSVINAGSYIHSGAVIDTMVSLGRNVHIGSHAKICANCNIGDNAQIKEWMVVWGGGGRAGLGRLSMRKRANDRGGVVAGAGRSRDNRDGGAEQEMHILGGRAVEEGRLVVMSKERDVLRKLIAPGGGPRKK